MGWRDLFTTKSPAASGGGRSGLESSTQRAFDALDSGEMGRVGNDMTGADIAPFAAWVEERFDAGDYASIWTRRLTMGYGLAQHDADLTTWQLLNARCAVAAIRIGQKQHPLTSTCAGFADQAYYSAGGPSNELATQFKLEVDRAFGFA